MIQGIGEYYLVIEKSWTQMRIPHLIILVLWGTLEWFIFRIFTIFIKVNPKIIQRHEKMTKFSSKLFDFKRSTLTSTFPFSY